MTNDEAAHFGQKIALALLATDQQELDAASIHITGTIAELWSKEPFHAALAVQHALSFLAGHFMLERGAKGPLTAEEAQRFRDHLDVLYMELGITRQGDTNE